MLRFMSSNLVYDHPVCMTTTTTTQVWGHRLYGGHQGQMCTSTPGETKDPCQWTGHAGEGRMSIDQLYWLMSSWAFEFFFKM